MAKYIKFAVTVNIYLIFAKLYNNINYVKYIVYYLLCFTLMFRIFTACDLESNFCKVYNFILIIIIRIMQYLIFDYNMVIKNVLFSN